MFIEIVVNFGQPIYTVTENSSVQLTVTLSNPSSFDIIIQILDIDGLVTGEKYIKCIKLSIANNAKHIGEADGMEGIDDIGEADNMGEPNDDSVLYFTLIFVETITAQYDIFITDDNLLEEDQHFNLRIFQSLLPTGVHVGEFNQTTVIVVDDDCK